MTDSQTFILETKRLLLRRQIMKDLDALWALYCNPNITKYIPDAPRSREEAREELEWHMNGHPRHPELGLWATIHKETGKFIGRCGLLPWTIEGQQEVEVAYTLAQEYWRQGLAAEAAKGILQYGFEQLHLSRLICLIDPENIASQRVAEKIGMTLEKEGEIAAHRLRYIRLINTGRRSMNHPKVNEADFNTLWAEGRALTMEQAIEHVLAINNEQ